jgi:hypothetical protein
LSSFNKVEESLNKICNECTYLNTDKCNNKNCNIAFSKSVISYALNNSAITLDNGDKLIPDSDFKYYHEELLAEAISEIRKLCKQCSEDHSEQCVISLCRRSLESTILKEKATYPGNTLLYIMEVAKQNPDFANMIKRAYEVK